nr:hypothetical protein [Tanacetum cinerariifolium]
LMIEKDRRCFMDKFEVKTDETVYKEWEDRMERAATTASSLEAEYNSEKPSESEGFEKIIDFLNAKPIIYALTVNPTVYASCVKQFWTTAKVKKVDGQELIQALVDKQKKKIKPKRKQRQETEVYSPSSEIPIKESVPTPSNDTLPSGEDSIQLNELMIFCTNLQQQMREKIVKKEASTGDPVTTAGEVVTTASVEDSVAPTTATTADVDDELTLVKTLIAIKATKPKVISTAATTVTTTITHQELNVLSSINKGGKKLEVEMKAEIEEEERIAREKDEENRAVIEEWDDVQATINANRQRKYFAAKRAKEIRNKPPTTAQQKKLEQESAKKQKLGEQVEAEEDNGEQIEVEEDNDQREAEMKMYMKIIPDDEIAIDSIPLATKPPVIMLQHIDKEDMETLWNLVKAKYGNTRQEEGYERMLYGDLKVMFEPDVESEVWRKLQGNKVIIWKLFSSCGVHFVRFQNLHIFMLIERSYPLTPVTITGMLNKKLQADHWNEMCYQLLKLMLKQLKKE